MSKNPERVCEVSKCSEHSETQATPDPSVMMEQLQRLAEQKLEIVKNELWLIKCYRALIDKKLVF